MDAKSLYTQDDCVKSGYDFSIKGTVVVLNKLALPEGYHNQLFYCMTGNGANANPIGRSVFMAALSDGEFCRRNRSDVIGMLKLELLPDHARLQLSQIRPEGALDLKSHEPKYSGYSFLPDGRYANGVWLCNEKEVSDYVEMQKPYQHRIMICDRNDFCVMEVKEQMLIYPSPEQVAANGGIEEQSGGMEMK